MAVVCTAAVWVVGGAAVAKAVTVCLAARQAVGMVAGTAGSEARFAWEAASVGRRVASAEAAATVVGLVVAVWVAASVVGSVAAASAAAPAVALAAGAAARAAVAAGAAAWATVSGVGTVEVILVEAVWAVAGAAWAVAVEVPMAEAVGVGGWEV